MENQNMGLFLAQLLEGYLQKEETKIDAKTKKLVKDTVTQLKAYAEKEIKRGSESNMEMSDVKVS
jgi:hypothetical protein